MNSEKWDCVGIMFTVVIIICKYIESLKTVLIKLNNERRDVKT